ncbi:flagellar export chaperone FlgN [Butyrivibrio sp. M55]|uniref:flagellar export chaperone FlgN n=1 Tax=Butyrivibrio sp. M55 TaxID=1855323 RepID=UPI0008E9B460|nr:flagellar export chaperone FlgN [Butyrivibrio sp. M55]SFU66270.1 FlgN protein [Butyrivibrio sp. M55]
MLSSSMDMLEESLIKKIDIMSKIEEENERQKEILSDPDNVDETAFDNTVDKKGELIDKLISLDDGFQTLFDRVKEEVNANKDEFADQIRRMQDLIRDITARSASIEAAEHRNKRLAERYFDTARQKMNSSKQSSAVAFNYYRTMNNFKEIPPQFLDKKN